MEELISSKKISLKDILECFGKAVFKYNWSIFEFDGILLTKSEFDINVISDIAVQDKLGYKMSVRNLLKLASDIEQVYDLTLVGNIEQIKKFENTDAWRDGNSIVIEMVDCGDWELYSNDYNLISRLKNQLQ